MPGDGPLEVGGSLAEGVGEMRAGRGAWEAQDGQVAEAGLQTVDVDLLGDQRRNERDGVDHGGHRIIKKKKSDVRPSLTVDETAVRRGRVAGGSTEGGGVRPGGPGGGGWSAFCGGGRAGGSAAE